MSEQLDQEQQAYSQAIANALSVATQVAEATRILGMEEPLFRGGQIARHSLNGLVFSCQELRRGYFLALCYSEVESPNPDPFTWYGLEGCLAWLLSYDSHHAKWKAEAFSECIGDKAFSKLARDLLNEGYATEGGKLHFKRLNRAHTA
jgi:hypothetical protein